MMTVAWDSIGPTGSGRKILQSSNFPIVCSSCNLPITPGQVFIDSHHEQCAWIDVDALIKRSPEAEQILQDCGRIRLQRAALAVIKLYLEANIRPADTAGTRRDQ